ncbi:MAG: hypothetical protein GY861_10680 [bacterium]|nr:hypothetical protein [bacterium]
MDEIYQQANDEIELIKKHFQDPVYLTPAKKYSKKNFDHNCPDPDKWELLVYSKYSEGPGKPLDDPRIYPAKPKGQCLCGETIMKNHFLWNPEKKIVFPLGSKCFERFCPDVQGYLRKSMLFSNHCVNGCKAFPVPGANGLCRTCYKKEDIIGYKCKFNTLCIFGKCQENRHQMDLCREHYDQIIIPCMKIQRQFMKEFDTILWNWCPKRLVVRQEKDYDHIIDTEVTEFARIMESHREVKYRKIKQTIDEEYATRRKFKVEWQKAVCCTRCSAMLKKDTFPLCELCYSKHLLQRLHKEKMWNKFYQSIFQQVKDKKYISPGQIHCLLKPFEEGKLKQ